MTVTPTVAPVVTGTPRRGQTLRTSDGSWTFDEDYLTYTYEWLRCDAAGDNCNAIAGQVGNAYVLQSADVGSTIRSRVTATEHVNPAPGVGASLDTFSAFKNTHFGPDHAYSGSGAIFNRKCNPTPSGNGFQNQAVVCPTAWADGSGIFETNFPGIGDGLDFIFNSSVPRGSGNGILIADIGHILTNSLPANYGFSMDIRFPASGNPSGFPPFSGDPGTDEWNVLWELTDNPNRDPGGAGVQTNGFGIANFESPKPRFYCSSGNGTVSGKRRGKSSFVVQFDTWYSILWQGRLSKGSDGSVLFKAGLRGGTLETILSATGPTSNTGDGSPYIEFGFYGMNRPGNTRVQYANIRNLLG